MYNFSNEKVRNVNGASSSIVQIAQVVQQFIEFNKSIFDCVITFYANKFRESQNAISLKHIIKTY